MEHVKSERAGIIEKALEIMHWIPRAPLGNQAGGVLAMTAWQDAGGQPFLATGSARGSICVWDVAAATSIPMADAHAGPVWALTVASSLGLGALLVSGGADGAIGVWSLDALEPIKRIPASDHGQVRALVQVGQADGHPLFAASTGDGRIQVWDAVSGSQVTAFSSAHGAPVRALESWETAVGTQVLAAATADGDIHLWDLDSGAPLERPLTGHRAPVLTLHAYDGLDGAVVLASASDDGTIILWDPAAGTRISEPLLGHNAPVRALRTWRDEASGGSYIVSGGDDGTIRLWAASSGQGTGILYRGTAGQVRAMSVWSTRSTLLHLAYAGGAGSINLVDLTTKALIDRPFTGHTAAVLAITSWVDDAGNTNLASGGDDGSVRLWNPLLGEAIGDPLQGHSGPVRSLCAWSIEGNKSLIASGGDDGQVLIWNSHNRGDSVHKIPLPIGPVLALTTVETEPNDVLLACGGGDGRIALIELGKSPDSSIKYLIGHDGPVRALIGINEDGRQRLVSGGDDGKIRIWDAATAALVGDPITAHAAPIRVLNSWKWGRNVIVSSGGTDRSVRFWNPVTRRRALGVMLAKHDGTVLGLASWIDADGRHRLASTGTDRLIRIWDPISGVQVTAPLAGHSETVWGLACWQSAGYPPMLASASEDGTLRIWDLSTGDSIRSLSIGQVSMRAMSDSASKTDLLSRNHLAAAISEQLVQPSMPGHITGDGPTVVTIEGPWGSGKTTLMGMIEERLSVFRAKPVRPISPLTLHQVSVFDNDDSLATEAPPKAAGEPRFVTAWFNPWSHQSGQQVWAGLAAEIMLAAGQVLFPDDATRERYWFSKNWPRLDKYSVRRLIRRRSISPLLGVGAATAILPVILNLAGMQGVFDILGARVHASMIVAVLAAAVIVAGVLHTFVRYFFGKAANYLPMELFNGPLGGVTSKIANGEGNGKNLGIFEDSLLSTQVGNLALLQRSVDSLLRDLQNYGTYLVLFIDDLDRCSTRTTAEVFEAINVFLSGSHLHGRFVIGLDPAVVARRLDMYYRDFDMSESYHDEEEGLGWSFLRKLVQLPVQVPLISDGGVRKFVESVIGDSAKAVDPAFDGHVDRAESVESPGPSRRVESKQESQLDHRDDVAAVAAVSQVDMRAAPVPAPQFMDVVSLEGHVRVREFITQRLYDQPNRSIREAKRLLNVWQLYARILDELLPVSGPTEALDRATRLVVLSEIVTRWPQLQRAIHRRVGDSRGLELLADAIGSDDEWNRVVRLVGIEDERLQSAVASLRELLRDHEGAQVAALATLLL